MDLQNIPVSWNVIWMALFITVIAQIVKGFVPNRRTAKRASVLVVGIAVAGLGHLYGLTKNIFLDYMIMVILATILYDFGGLQMVYSFIEKKLGVKRSDGY